MSSRERLPPEEASHGCLGVSWWFLQVAIYREQLSRPRARRVPFAAAVSATRGRSHTATLALAGGGRGRLPYRSADDGWLRRGRPPSHVATLHRAPCPVPGLFLFLYLPLFQEDLRQWGFKFICSRVDSFLPPVQSKWNTTCFLVVRCHLKAVCTLFIKLSTVQCSVTFRD